MKLDLLVEAVNVTVPVWAKKFNNGSILSNGKWYSVKKPVDIEAFQKGNLVTVEIESTESKGKTYENITKVLSSETVSKPKTTTKATTVYGTITTDKGSVVGRDYDKEAKGKSRFGLYASAMESPYLAANSSSLDEFKTNADDLVEYFMSKIFNEDK